jgi:hypothetical protein
MAAASRKRAGAGAKAELPATVRIKIISMGDSETGKSCLIKRFCEGKVRAGRAVERALWSHRASALRSARVDTTACALCSVGVCAVCTAVHLDHWRGLRREAGNGQREGGEGELLGPVRPP